MLRRFLFWTGWFLLLAYTVIFFVQVYLIQNIPEVSKLQWAALAATVILIYAARNREEVVNYHLPH